MAGNAPSIGGRIEELWQDHRELVEYLRSANQLQLSVRAEESFSKTLVIAVASYFEVCLCQVIVGLYSSLSDGSELLVQFVINQGISRRFSQMFDWGGSSRPGRNANRFYSLFGPEFADYMKVKVRDDRRLEESIRAFLEIGNLRNQMVHENYANFQLGKNVEEIYKLYEEAGYFLNVFPVAVREFIDSASGAVTP